MLGAVGPEASPRLEQGESHAYLGADGGQGWNRCADCILELKIKDYVTVTAAHDGWERVTFADALNMATGIGDNAPWPEPNEPLADALMPKGGLLSRADTLAQRVTACTGHYGRVAVCYCLHPETTLATRRWRGASRR